MKKTHRTYDLHLFSVERGVILIVALVMLLVMTVAGVTTMTGATLQERIAGNQRQRLVARINADRALKVAEAYLSGLSATSYIDTAQARTDFSGLGSVDDDGLYTTQAFEGESTVKPLTFERIDEDAWNAGNSIAVPNEDNVTSRYVIEYLGGFDPSGYSRGQNDLSGDDAEKGQARGDNSISARKVFRITAIGYGANTNVVSVLESYYMEAAKQ